MDDDHLPSLLTLGLLILLHAGVQLAYSALTNVRLTPLKERAEAGDPSARNTLHLVENLPQLRITADVLLLMVRFALVTVAVVNIALPLLEDAQGGILSDTGLTLLVVLIPLWLLTFFIGDVTASSLGRAKADEMVMLAAPLLGLLTFAFKPVIALVIALEGLISKLSGGESIEKQVTEEEIMTLVDVGHSGGTIENDEKEMIYSVLQFNEIAVREIMIPRPDITAFEIDDPIRDVLKTIVETGHSRIPVYEGEIDNIKGMVFAKDLLSLVHRGELESATLRQLLRSVHFVPGSKRADVLFKEMQTGNIHIAIVVDEYGSTSGMVTIEDLLEEIVGDIRDEYDQNEESEFTELAGNTFLVDGAMQLSDLNERLGVELSTEDSDTLGGYIYTRLESAPQAGQTVEAERLLLRIEKVENQRIRKVHITLLPTPVDAGDDATSTQDAPVERTNGRDTGTLNSAGGAIDRPARAVLR